MTPRRSPIVLVIALACMAMTPSRDPATHRLSIPADGRSETLGLASNPWEHRASFLAAGLPAHVDPADFDDEDGEFVPTLVAWLELGRLVDPTIPIGGDHPRLRASDLASTRLRC